MEKLIQEHEVNNFLSDVENTFPNFVAGVIVDRHGFPIAARMPDNFHIQENQMALSAIAGKRDIIQDPRFLKVKRHLDESKNVRLFVLLEKSNQYINRFKSLKNIIASQTLF